MINNQSDKPEKFQPKDSERKDIRHPGEDEKAVVKPEDETYTGEDADFHNVAKKKENSEQPFMPVKKTGDR